MKIVYVFDEDGFYDKPVLFELVGRLEIPEDRYTEVQPDDFIRAKWTGETWVEGADDDYMEHLDSMRGGKEASPVDKVKEEIERISEDKELTQMAVAELTETMFSEINSIKAAIVELASSLIPLEEKTPEPDGGENNG